MTDTRGMELADFIRDLTQAHRHDETYTIRVASAWVTRHHVTTAPPLITQLWDNDVPSGAAEEGPRAGYSSRPVARLDALDAAARIDLEVNRWITDLGETAPLDTIAALLRLNGLAVSTDHVTNRAITNDARRWWIRARVVTGWDSAAWSPDNTCPQCAVRGSLRVRLADQIATCIEDVCRSTWDSTNIGLLADHIREESALEREPIRRPDPCSCPWPMPVLPDMEFLCPRCGSSRCTHALRRRLVDTLRAMRTA